MAENGNGKWQLAFWIVTVIFFVSSGALTTSVIANDRLRALEDRRIEIKIESAKDCKHSIDTRLARIEERLGITNGRSNLRTP